MTWLWSNLDHYCVFPALILECEYRYQSVETLNAVFTKSTNTTQMIFISNYSPEKHLGQSTQMSKWEAARGDRW